jgi:hypothetical protein
MNGHEAHLNIYCEKCGAPVVYRQACEELVKLPEIRIDFGEMAVLTIGFPSLAMRGTYSGEINLGESEEIKAGSLFVKRIEGGTWLDYYRNFTKICTKWMRLVGFDRCKYKIVVIDTVNPLSVLTLATSVVDGDTLVFAIIADEDSIPIEQNTSYVALQVAIKKKLPLFVANRNYVDDLACFVEDEGLVVGPKALREIILFALNCIGDILDFVKKDIKLGVNLHALSSLMAASDRVYRNVQEALTVQRKTVSVDLVQEDVQMAYLIAASRKDLAGELITAFHQYRKAFPGLIISDHIIKEKDSRYGFYDLCVLYGIKELPSLVALKKGYLTVVEKANDLKVEEIL